MEDKLKECSASVKASADKQKQDTEELKKELEDCQKKREEYLAGWQRSRADFLNYKKEEAARFKELLQYALEDIILEILLILDNFEKAAQQDFLTENLDGKEKEKINQVIQGYLQIKTQLQDFLKCHGVEEIKSLGQKFDPNFHEVVEEAAGGESGIITEEVKKGYKLNGKVIRPAKVKVPK